MTLSYGKHRFGLAVIVVLMMVASAFVCVSGEDISAGTAVDEKYVVDGGIDAKGNVVSSYDGGSIVMFPVSKNTRYKVTYNGNGPLDYFRAGMMDANNLVLGQSTAYRILALNPQVQDIRYHVLDTNGSLGTEITAGSTFYVQSGTLTVLAVFAYDIDNGSSSAVTVEAAPGYKVTNYYDPLAHDFSGNVTLTGWLLSFFESLLGKDIKLDLNITDTELLESMADRITYAFVDPNTSYHVYFDSANKTSRFKVMMMEDFPSSTSSYSLTANYSWATADTNNTATFNGSSSHAYIYSGSARVMLIYYFGGNAPDNSISYSNEIRNNIHIEPLAGSNAYVGQNAIIALNGNFGNSISVSVDNGSNDSMIANKSSSNGALTLTTCQLTAAHQGDHEVKITYKLNIEITNSLGWTRTTSKEISLKIHINVIAVGHRILMYDYDAVREEVSDSLSSLDIQCNISNGVVVSSTGNGDAAIVNSSYDGHMLHQNGAPVWIYDDGSEIHIVTKYSDIQESWFIVDPDNAARQYVMLRPLIEIRGSAQRTPDTFIEADLSILESARSNTIVVGAIFGDAFYRYQEIRFTSGDLNMVYSYNGEESTLTYSCPGTVGDHIISSDDGGYVLNLKVIVGIDGGFIHSVIRE